MSLVRLDNVPILGFHAASKVGDVEDLLGLALDLDVALVEPVVVGIELQVVMRVLAHRHSLRLADP